MKFNKYIAYIISLLALLPYQELFAAEKCDSVKDCTGRALNLSVTTGTGAHYVDVPLQKSLTNIRNEFTVEMWVKPDRQPGKREYIAGLWGPLTDKNDVWVIYIDINDDIVFEVNGNSSMKSADNTIIRYPAAPLFKTWFHLAAVFNGNTQTTSLFINGILAGTSKNDLYPLSVLNIPKDKLPLQIGSSNALLDDQSANRTLLGWIDEVRIWNYVRTPDEIYCDKDKSLEGNEPGLALYYRMNETPSVYNLCDASGNGNIGRARSGARCRDGGNRQRIKTVFINPVTDINDIMKCDTTVTYNFTIQDTSYCGSTYGVTILDDKVSRYTITPNKFDLVQGQAQNFSVKIDRKQTGPFNSRLYIYPYNRCGVATIIKMNLDRKTELSVSKSGINFGKVIADCEEVPYVDSIIRICNETPTITTSRNLTIYKIETNLKGIIDPVLPNGVTLPYTLAPGQCIDIRVRFNPISGTRTHFDTLKIISDDICYGSGIIPITGISQEAIGIYYPGTKTRIDTVKFDNTCIGRFSRAEEYSWENLLDFDITVDTIIVPDQFRSQVIKFDYTLKTKYGYLPNYLLFVPTARGSYNDSIIFIVRAGGCTVRRVLYIKGKCISPDVRFKTTELDFGKVKVGQSKMMFATAVNYGDEPVTIMLYVMRGEVFNAVIETRTIGPGDSVSLPISFWPIGEQMYFDKVCFTEKVCYTLDCIPIKGEGYYDHFRFNPDLMKTENVLACSSMLDTLWIVNESVVTQTLESFVLNSAGKYTLVDPPVLPDQLIIASGDSARFIFRFTPNDLTQDVTERAFLRFRTLPDLDDWEAKLYGTSLLPKIFVTAQTLYGTLEVNDTRQRTVIIENTSPYEMTIDSITVTDGFILISPPGNKKITLKPREQIKAVVEFRPTESKMYYGKINVYSSSPCIVEGEGGLQGEGIIMPLEVPLKVISFGFATPCGCILRKIPLVNRSLTFPMSVDSIWIDDGSGSTSGSPRFFTWTASGSKNGNLPYPVEKQTTDTIFILFCPRTPATIDNIDHSAVIHIKAHGEGWSGTYETSMIGKRALMMFPMPDYVLFPPTQVDASSKPENVYFTIPGVQVNPAQDTVIIDSITFEPDDRVFFSDIKFPKIVKPGSVDSVEVTFKPRAVRNYKARMVLHISKPCVDTDTTVLVEGNAFAPPYGLEFEYELRKPAIDTFRVINCEVLEIPVFASRELPADVIDIKFRLLFDDTKLQFLDARSPFAEKDTCYPHIPNITYNAIPGIGEEYFLKNLCHVDSTLPLIIARFKPFDMNRNVSKIKVDTTYFDTEEVILYDIIVELDSGYVVILQPEIEIQNTVDFGRVDVLDCVQRTLMIRNIGDVPVTIDSIFTLPKDVKIISSVPPLNSYLPVGEMAEVTFEFCPRRKQIFNIDSLISESKAPCILLDTTRMTGEGYAPPFEFHSDISFNVSAIDNINTRITDTIGIPVIFERDFASTIKGVTYWLEGLKFNISMNYNPYTLKYLSTENRLDAGLKVDYHPGKLVLHYTGVDSISAGEIAMNYFLVTVPDSTMSLFSYDASDFDTDSILFLDIIPKGTESRLNIEGRCHLTSLNYDGLKPKLKQNVPNPWSETTDISFSLNEKSNCALKLYNSNNVLIDVLQSGILGQGEYTYTLDAERLAAGFYYYILTVGEYNEVKSMILIK
jgi:hypothetical protein